MVTGEITLDIDEEDKTSLQQILGQLEGILQYQQKHRNVIVLYDSQRTTFDQILETALQANYHISRFYVTEEEC